jgi:cobalt-zinc-cadmium resistance protein CzcA
LEKAKLLPDWGIGYTNQSVIGWQMDKNQANNYYGAGNRFSTAQISIGIPIFTKAQKARIHAARQMQAVTELQTISAAERLGAQMQQYWTEYNKYQQAIQYYIQRALPEADIIIQTANLKYKNGDINYIEWSTLLSNSINLQVQYTDALKELNMRKIELEYLLQQN